MVLTFPYRLRTRRRVALFLIALTLSLACELTVWAAQTNSSTIAIEILDESLGVSTQYIGAVEGNANFDRADLEDLGINCYRLYGGMSRWEPEDDDGVYGLPTIAQIKRDPNVINWARWDQIMTRPKTGSDYYFSGDPEQIWQGSAQTIFETLKQAQIRPVVTIRNTDPGWNPDWALQLNPPRSTADWQEWWEHVFATVYWLNVRNDYRVDDFEIHNEPNYRGQGWGGTQADYLALVQVAADAISHVYATYLPDRTVHIHAPKTTGGSDWPEQLLDTLSTEVTHINVHSYDRNIADFVQRMRSWMRGTPHAEASLWLGEWGTYTGGYDDLPFSLDLLKNMVQMSQPGDSHVEGSLLFSLYDWGQDEKDATGLIGGQGDRRLSYYAFRMGIRALQGGRPVLRTGVSGEAAVSDLMLIATRDSQNKVFLLVINSGSKDYPVQASLPHSTPFTQARVWGFGEERLDEIVAEERLETQTVSFEVPAYSGRLLVVD